MNQTAEAVYSTYVGSGVARIIYLGVRSFSRITKQITCVFGVAGFIGVRSKPHLIARFLFELHFIPRSSFSDIMCVELYNANKKQ